jgi:hypothetical protein
MISLIHPSRGRPGKSRSTYLNWSSKATYSFEYILSVDRDDPELQNYKIAFDENNLVEFGGVGLVRDNKSVVEATNVAAKRSTEGILIYLSDDFDCPDRWDELILKEFEGVTEPMLLKVDDCLQGFDVRVLTIPIMNRALYEKLGYFWHPDYKSMFVDEDLWWTCRNNGWLKKAPHLKFPHNHHSLGKCQNDETYRRSEANWDQGKATFARRKAAGFPL